MIVQSVPSYITMAILPQSCKLGYARNDGVHEWLYTKISCCFTGIWSIKSKLPEAYLVRAWMGGFSLADEADLVISLIRWLCAILNISEVLEIRLRWSSGAKLVLCFIVRISVSIKERGDKTEVRAYFSSNTVSLVSNPVLSNDLQAWRFGPIYMEKTSNATEFSSFCCCY